MSDTSMGPEREPGKRSTGQILEMPKPNGVPFVLDITKERIYRAWLRGVRERKLARVYDLTRAEVEAIVREQVLSGGPPRKPPTTESGLASRKRAA